MFPHCVISAPCSCCTTSCSCSRKTSSYNITTSMLCTYHGSVSLEGPAVDTYSLGTSCTREFLSLVSSISRSCSVECMGARGLASTCTAHVATDTTSTATRTQKSIVKELSSQKDSFSIGLAVIELKCFLYWCRSVRLLLRSFSLYSYRAMA